MHSQCGSHLYLDISNGLKIFVAFGIDRNGLKPFHGELRIIEKEINSNFFCSNCNVNVPLKEVVATCMYCGRTQTIEDHEFYTLNKSGGIYCISCANSYFDEESKIPLKKVYQKVRF
jgi:hypothetical protein